jgi:hypothetical protein
MGTSNTDCKNKPCGCEDTPLYSPLPCNPIDCPDPYPCSEVSNAECVIYTGPDITCGQDIVVPSGATMSEALAAIVNYFCP